MPVAELRSAARLERRSGQAGERLRHPSTARRARMMDTPIDDA